MALPISFVRLLDKAILEYRRGSGQWLHSAGGHDFVRLLRAADDFETCIGATHRACRLADAMRRNRHRQLPEIEESLMLSVAMMGRLTRVRNAIEPAGGDLVKGPLPLDHPAYLAPMRSRLQILSHSSTSANLADTIR